MSKNKYIFVMPDIIENIHLSEAEIVVVLSKHVDKTYLVKDVLNNEDFQFFKKPDEDFNLRGLLGDEVVYKPIGRFFNFTF